MVSTTTVFFPWQQEYSVQHPGIDNQHQRLVLLVNDLYTAMAEGQGRTAVDRVLAGLVDYTKSHFSYEEREMASAGYPAILQHKEEHRKLLEQTERFATKWRDSQPVNAVELATFLKGWLLNHIGQTDRPLAGYLSRR